MGIRTTQVTGFVPQQHRWLATLYTHMERAGFRLAEAVLADSQLRLVHDGPPALTLVVTARGQRNSGWAATDRYVLGFQGSFEPLPEQRRLLVAFETLLRALEGRMPPDLKGFAAIVASQRPPAEQVRHLFPFLDIEQGQDNRGNVTEVLVRTTGRCNQACPFCSAPHHDEPASEALVACFHAVAKLLPGALLNLTGGEPTLRRHFISEVRAALELAAIGHIQIQTNAVRFAQTCEARSLSASSRLSFFVSLHAIVPDLYDRCTGTRGQLPQALQGIANLLQAGHRVTLNTVVNCANLDHLETLIATLSRQFPAPQRPTLHFSVLICPEQRPQAAQWLVPYRQLAPVLEQASLQARAEGFDVESLLASSHASMPPCTLSADQRQTQQRRLTPEAHETGYETTDTRWVKAQRCRLCAEDPHCLGVPQPYAQHFGLAELTPLEAE